MLFDFNGEDATVKKSGSITDAQGSTFYLAAHHFDVSKLGYWASPTTGCTYPAGWTVTIGREVFSVQPAVQDHGAAATASGSARYIVKVHATSALQ